MKDIDELLKKSPRPTRELDTNFTKKTLLEIKNNPAPMSWFAGVRQKALRHVWLTSVAGLLLLGGTAAAVALWPTPHVTPILSKQLPSGNHIVGYNATNCDYYSDLDGHTTPPASNNIYYEVRQGANLTDEQLQASLQAVCEENISNNVITRIENQLPKKGNSTQNYIIKDISPGSITLDLDSHYNKTQFVLKTPQTYTHFSDSLLVYNQDTKASYGALKVGDSIKFIYNDTSGQVQTPNNNYIDLNHPENTLISAILIVPPLTADPDVFYTSVAQDVVRLDSCSSSPTGFCRAYDFVNN